MMLEKILEALVGLTTALNAHTAALGADSPKAVTRARAAKDTAVAGASAPNTATTASQGSTLQAASNTAVAPSGTAPVALAQAAGEAMCQVANEVSRVAAIEILAKFGAATFAGVKADDHAAFRDACLAALKPAVAQTGASGLF